jgi:hypothetical protein
MLVEDCSADDCKFLSAVHPVILPDEKPSDSHTCLQDLFKGEKKNESDFVLADIGSPLSVHDALKMARLNIKHDFREGQDSSRVPLKEGLEWRRNITELVVLIFKKTCPKKYVPDAFVNVIRELSLVYHNSLKAPPEERTSVWGGLRTNLQQCLAHITETKLDLRSKGYEARKELYSSLALASNSEFHELLFRPSSFGSTRSGAPKKPMTTSTKGTRMIRMRRIKARELPGLRRKRSLMRNTTERKSTGRGIRKGLIFILKSTKFV